MIDATQTARRLLEQTGHHHVLSLYFDLDPREFATGAARATQLRSLIDEARASLDGGDTALDHAERQALIAGIDRVESFLASDQAPMSGARALAVFCSPEDDLFEMIRLYDPASPQVVIAQKPYLEPLVSGAGSLAGDWCVALVNRSTARILAGSAAHLWERGELDDDVRGQHRQGGWSQARYERRVDVEVERHLQHVAEEIRLRLEREPFETLVLGGPEDTVSRLAEMLHGDVKPRLSGHRLSVDVENSSADEIREALEPLLELHRGAVENAALERLRHAQGAGGRAVSGLQDTRLALVERRVETLLLSPAFHGKEQVRAELIEQAILQNASVLAFREPPPETHLREGIGALLRF